MAHIDWKAKYDRSQARNKKLRADLKATQARYERFVLLYHRSLDYLEKYGRHISRDDWANVIIRDIRDDT